MGLLSRLGKKLHILGRSPEPPRPAYTSFARPAPSVSRLASSSAPLPVRLPLGSV